MAAANIRGVQLAAARMRSLERRRNTDELNSTFLARRDPEGRFSERDLSASSPARPDASPERGGHLRLQRRDLVELFAPLAILSHHDAGDEHIWRDRLAFIGAVEPRREGPHAGIR